jgi:hypothetical protein
MSEAQGQAPHGQSVQPPEFLDLPPDPPAWPKVIGIISIVFGSLGIGCMGCSGVGLVIQPMFMGSAEAQFGPMPDVMKPPLSQIIMMPLGALVAAMLIIAGVLLLKRVAVSRVLHIVYAILNIVMSIAGTVTGILQVGRGRSSAVERQLPKLNVGSSILLARFLNQSTAADVTPNGT